MFLSSFKTNDDYGLILLILIDRQRYSKLIAKSVEELSFSNPLNPLFYQLCISQLIYNGIGELLDMFSNISTDGSIRPG